MKYYLGIDYFLCFEDFPHMGVPGYISPNSDGTVDIGINTLYCQERQVEALKHELRHLAKNHFYCDYMTLEEKELDADNINDPSCIFADDFSSVEYEEAQEVEESEPELPDVLFDHPPDQIACFHSLESMENYVQKYLVQRRRKREELRSRS